MADYDVYENVAIISINKPPVNSLGLKVRQALFNLIEKAKSDLKVCHILSCENHILIGYF